MDKNILVYYEIFLQDSRTVTVKTMKILNLVETYCDRDSNQIPLGYKNEYFYTAFFKAEKYGLRGNTIRITHNGVCMFVFSLHIAGFD
jgi:hypothetical protein